jgi:hypothetical protein
MKEKLLIIFISILGLFACKKQVEEVSPEFIGYWSGGSYAEYGYMYIRINESSGAYVYALDYNNDHEYDSRGTARANDKKLTIGGIKYFKIIEYPHQIDTAVEKEYIFDHTDNTAKLANWKMVLDGLHNSSINVGERTYYKSDF